MSIFGRRHTDGAETPQVRDTISAREINSIRARQGRYMIDVEGGHGNERHRARARHNRPEKAGEN